MDRDSFHKALEFELMREQAGTLGEAGKRLDAALQRYASLSADRGTAEHVTR